MSSIDTSSAAGDSAGPTDRASGPCADKNPASARVEAATTDDSRTGSTAAGVEEQRQNEQLLEDGPPAAAATGAVATKRARDGARVGAKQNGSGTSRTHTHGTRSDSDGSKRPPTQSLGLNPKAFGYSNSGGGGAAAAGVESTANTGFGQQAAAANAPTAQETQTVAAVLMIAGQSHSISALISINRDDMAALGIPNGPFGQPPAPHSFGQFGQQQQHLNAREGFSAQNNQFRPEGRGGRGRGRYGGHRGRWNGDRGRAPDGAPPAQPAQTPQQPDATRGNNSNGMTPSSD